MVSKPQVTTTMVSQRPVVSIGHQPAHIQAMSPNPAYASHNLGPPQRMLPATEFVVPSNPRHYEGDHYSQSLTAGPQPVALSRDASHDSHLSYQSSQGEESRPESGDGREYYRDSDADYDSEAKRQRSCKGKRYQELVAESGVKSFKKERKVGLPSSVLLIYPRTITTP